MNCKRIAGSSWGSRAFRGVQKGRIQNRTADIHDQVFVDWSFDKQLLSRKRVKVKSDVTMFISEWRLWETKSNHMSGKCLKAFPGSIDWSIDDTDPFVTFLSIFEESPIVIDFVIIDNLPTQISLETYHIKHFFDTPNNEISWNNIFVPLS
jgi:hypothetical protein